MLNFALARMAAPLSPWAGAAMAALIFAFGTMSSPSVAVGAAYLAAVLVAGRFCRTRGVALTAFWCACLILLAAYLRPENPINAIIRIGAIGIGTFLALKAQAAEDAARRSELESREVFEHSPIMYFMVDAGGTILSVNAAGADELGYRLDELTGQSLLKVVPDAERERVRANLDLCLQSRGQTNTWEVQKVRKDGATLWVRENAKAITRSNGAAVVLIACEDVTERRRAEEAARESARRFRALIEHAYDVVLLLDRDGAILYASPSVERVLGYPPRELVGRSSFDFVHPDQAEEARNRSVQGQRRPGSVYASERLVRHKHGNWIWTEGTETNLLDEPSVRAVVVNFRDTDARKRAEEALRESEQRFRDYAETASDWYWETGPDHRLTTISDPYFGAGLGAARWDLAADLDEEPEKWRAHRAALDAREPFRAFTYRATRADGSTVWVSVSGRPVFDRQGRYLGYRGVATDVSDRIRADEAERALQAARMELAHIARLTSLGELSASIAHEINQPVAAVILNAGAALRWLDADPPNMEEARKTLASVARDARRASDVIGRIRALAKKDPVVADRLDINEAIREVIALTSGEIVRNRVRLTTGLAEPAPPILGDRVQLQQVILNLIVNAIEAIGDEEPRELSVESRIEERNILVSISDSGRGLDPANAERVFEAFYSTKPGGMGMGLAICQSILEAHHGKIWARPNGKRGSTFEFALPIEAEPRAPAL